MTPCSHYFRAASCIVIMTGFKYKANCIPHLITYCQTIFRLLHPFSISCLLLSIDTLPGILYYYHQSLVLYSITVDEVPSSSDLQHHWRMMKTNELFFWVQNTNEWIWENHLKSFVLTFISVSFLEILSYFSAMLVCKPSPSNMLVYYYYDNVIANIPVGFLETYNKSDW